MSNDRGAPRGGFGPGQTMPSEPSFADQGAPPDPPPPFGPMAGSAVPPTITEDDPGPGYGAPPPHAGYAPQDAGYAPQQYNNGPSAYGPSAGYGAGGPAPIPPVASRGRGRPRGQGPSLVLIGVIAFVLIGGVTTIFALKGRTSSDDDKPTPTVNVPAPVNVPSDTGAVPTEAPPIEPPPTATQAPPPGPLKRGAGLLPGTKPKPGGSSQPPPGKGKPAPSSKPTSDGPSIGPFQLPKSPF